MSAYGYEFACLGVSECLHVRVDERADSVCLYDSVIKDCH